MFRYYSAVITALVVFSSFVNADCTTVRCLRKQSEFKTLIEHYQKIYCYIEVKETQYSKNFEDLSKIYLARIHNTTTADEYMWLLREWAAEFKDGHVNFMPMAGGQDFQVNKFPIKLTLLQPATTSETLVVSSSDLTNVPVGSIVLKISGKEALQAVTETEHFRSGSTPQMRRRYAGAAVLSGQTKLTGSNSFELDISTPQGAQIPVRIQGTQVPFSTEVKPPEDPVQTVFGKMLPGGILHVNIIAFVSGQTEYEFDDLLVNLHQEVKGVIFDVRNNAGGHAVAYEPIIANLLDTNEKAYTFYRSPRVTPLTIHYRPTYSSLTLMGGTEFAQWENSTITSDEALSTLLVNKPVVVLTGPACFSACDTFVSTMKWNGLAQIAGETTAGGTGQPIVFELPETHHFFRYGVVRGETILHQPIEGVGTAPDVYIPQTVKDIRDQTDYQLEEVLTLFPTFKPTHLGPLRRLALVKPKLNPLKYSEETWEQYLISK